MAWMTGQPPRTPSGHAPQRSPLPPRLQNRVALTAFIVCSGNRGRGDVAHRAAMRLAGAGAGTLAATALSGVFTPGD